MKVYLVCETYNATNMKDVPEPYMTFYGACRCRNTANNAVFSCFASDLARWHTARVLPNKTNNIYDELKYHVSNSSHFYRSAKSAENFISNHYFPNSNDVKVVEVNW